MMTEQDIEEQQQREDVDMMSSNGSLEDAAPVQSKSPSAEEKRNKLILISAVIVSIIIVGGILGGVVSASKKRNKKNNGSFSSVSSNANFVDGVPTTSPTSATPTKAPISSNWQTTTLAPTLAPGSSNWYTTPAPMTGGAQFTGSEPTTLPTVRPPTTAQFIDDEPPMTPQPTIAPSTSIPTKNPTAAPIVTSSPTQSPIITPFPTAAPITTTNSPTAKPVSTNPPTPSPVTTTNPTPMPITSSPTSVPITPGSSGGGGSSIQTGTSATIISEPSIRIYQVTNTRNLLSSSNSRSMNSTGGISYEYNSNTGFTSSVYYNGVNAIAWDPNTINTQIDDVYFYQDDPTWPTIEQSRFNDDLTEVVTVGIIFVTDKGQELLSAITNKQQELMNSNSFQISSEIYDTTGSMRGYKTTTRLDSGIQTSSSWQNGYSWYISNTTGFYSRDVTVEFDDSSSSYSPSDYKVFHYENDVNTVTFEWEYIDNYDSNKSIKEGVVFETKHASQLLQYMKTKFY